MPIDLGWMGDGWIYYSDKERKEMSDKKKKDFAGFAIGCSKIELPSDEHERIEIAYAAALSVKCCIVPIGLVKLLIASAEKGAVPSFAIDQLKTLAGNAEVCIEFQRFMDQAGNN